jgi:hypothetical protein
MTIAIIIGVGIVLWFCFGYYGTTDKYKIKRIYKIFRTVKLRTPSDEPRTTMNINTLGIYNKKLMEALFYVEGGRQFLNIIGESENAKDLASAILYAEESFFGKKYHFSPSESTRLHNKEKTKKRLLEEIYNEQNMSKYE